MPSLERAAELTFRAIAERRMAALGLAIRLYEIDHGQRPETLDALVPEYLPGLPRDPFAAADRPIGYLRDDPQPRLYSVGANGVDEGGTYQLDRSGYVDSDVADLVFFLNGDRPQAPWKPPASRPSTRPASQPSGAP
jgi:hypothetical protein